MRLGGYPKACLESDALKGGLASSRLALTSTSKQSEPQGFFRTASSEVSVGRREKNGVGAAHCREIGVEWMTPALPLAKQIRPKEVVGASVTRTLKGDQIRVMAALREEGGGGHETPKIADDPT